MGSGDLASASPPSTRVSATPRESITGGSTTKRRKTTTSPTPKTANWNHALPGRNAGAELVEFLCDRFDGAPLRGTAKAPGNSATDRADHDARETPDEGHDHDNHPGESPIDVEAPSPKGRRCHCRTRMKPVTNPATSPIAPWCATVFGRQVSRKWRLKQTHARSSNNVVSSGPLLKHSREITIRSRETTTPMRAAAQIGFTTRL